VFYDFCFLSVTQRIIVLYKISVTFWFSCHCNYFVHYVTIYLSVCYFCDTKCVHICDVINDRCEIVLRVIVCDGFRVCHGCMKKW